MQYFGDSYDVVKRFLLKTLSPVASWVAFPMFTHPVTRADVEAFESFLGVRVVASGPFDKDTDRAKHFVTLSEHHHVFLDPDTGIKLRPTRAKNAANYIFAPEIESLCQSDIERLLLVFDQSVGRGSERMHVTKKLSYFTEKGISAFAYMSHACFMVLSASPTRCKEAKEKILSSGMPAERLL
jgi:hypothetical protein